MRCSNKKKTNKKINVIQYEKTGRSNRYIFKTVKEIYTYIQYSTLGNLGNGAARTKIKQKILTRA